MIYRKGSSSTKTLKLNCGSTITFVEARIYRRYVSNARTKAQDLNIGFAKFKLHRKNECHELFKVAFQLFMD
ncbi:hypothetical protein EPIB1_1077 [Tritonibacter mobilis]|nr:hypothetical protein EPIB1_1077 [Tritonibacter mobilis]